MASIDMLNSGKFRVRFMSSSTTGAACPDRRQTRTFPTLEDAERFRDLLDRARDSAPAEDSRGTAPASLHRFDRFAQQWFETHATVIKPATSWKYLGYINKHLIPTFGLLMVEEITKGMIQGWQTGALNEGMSPRTLQYNRTILNMIFNAAVEDGLIGLNPSRTVRAPKVPTKEIRLFTEPEIVLLTQAMEPRFRSFVPLGAYCGLRIGELLTLRLEDLDMSTGMIHVRRSLTRDIRGRQVVGPPKSETSRRSLSMPPVAIRSLAKHIESGYVGRDTSIFSGAVSRQAIRDTDFRNRYWRKACQNAGVRRANPHDLRHTAVSLWIKAGASPKLVAARAGHSSVNFVFNTYGHLFDNEDADLAARLGQGL